MLYIYIYIYIKSNEVYKCTYFYSFIHHNVDYVCYICVPVKR